MVSKGKFKCVSRLFVLFLFLISFLTGISIPVLAQDEKKSEDEFTLEEVVVTAEKREATIQKIPMDISVVRMDDMRMYGVNQLYDLQQIVPQLSASSSVGNNILVSIREVQQKLFNAMYETTVSTHLDGIQLTRSNSMENFFFDLERTEVLMGPQGTLYGRGTTAGTINMITKKPVLNEFGGTFSTEVGNYGRFRTDLALNAPLGDKMAVRYAGRRNLFDGYNDAEFGNNDSWSHRLSYRWEPNDRLTFNLLGDYIDRDEHGYYTDGYYYDTYGDVEIVAKTGTVVDPLYQSGGPISTRGKVKWAWGDAAKSNIVSTEQYGVQGSVAYEADYGTYTFDYGYRSQRDTKEYYLGNAVLAPVSTTRPATQVWVNVTTPALWTNPFNTTHTTTGELRLASNTNIPAGDPLEWIVGVMGQRDTVRTGVYMPTWGYDVTVTTKTEGAFAQASWMPFKKWNFTAGVRQNWDAKDYWGIGRFPVTGGVPDTSPANFTATDAKWSELTYRANISYIATDDIMPYVTYSKGYRSGNIGFNKDNIISGNVTDIGPVGEF
jgi:iron complex outermembrane recepter protein